MSKIAIFAGGCFWGIQKKFEDLKNIFPGILETKVGYCGGFKKNPSYKQVCSGNTGHTESIKIKYNPKLITYEKLCSFFMKIPQSTIKLKTQYKSAIFYTSKYQKTTAKKIINKYKNMNTQIELIEYKNNFYNAEEYHQHYLKKNKLKCSS